MEEDLNFSKMEDDLNFKQIIWQMEDEPNPYPGDDAFPNLLEGWLSSSKNVSIFLYTYFPDVWRRERDYYLTANIINKWCLRQFTHYSYYSYL